MIVTAEVKNRVTATLQAGIAKAEAAYGIKVKMPTVVYKKRGSTAGTASFRTWTIDLNPVLLMENVDAYMARTVLHELGHLVTDLVYPEAHQATGVVRTRNGGMKRVGREPHGEQWQSVMITIGGPTTRCHSYDVSNAKIQKIKYQWKCTGCSHVYSVGGKINNQFTARNGGGRVCKCGSKQFFAVGVVVPKRPVVQAPVVKHYSSVTAAPVVKVMAEPKAGSKMDLCWELYQAYAAKGYLGDRQMMISLFVNNAGCTIAGAGTYYATLKKRYETT